MLASFAAVTLGVLVVGFIAGVRYERAARGWRDIRARKAELPILRAAARALTGRAAGAVLLALAVAVSALYALAVEPSP